MTLASFMGGEKEDITTIVENTANALLQQADTTYTDIRGDCLFSNSSSAENDAYWESEAFSLSEFWTGFRVDFPGFQANTYSWIKWYNSGTHRLGLRFDSLGTKFEAVKWNGSSWDLLGTTDFLSVSGSSNRYDVYIKLGNPGSFRLYKGGVPILALSGLDLSFVATIDKTRQQKTGTSNFHQTKWFEHIVADWNTIGSRVRTKTPDANGNYTGWDSGAAFGNIDETVPVQDYANSGSANQRFSFSTVNFSALASGETLEILRLGWLALRDAGGPQNINGFTRISATDYDGSDKSLNVTATRNRQEWAVSPATSAAWTISEINGAEFGLRSRT